MVLLLLSLARAAVHGAYVRINRFKPLETRPDQCVPVPTIHCVAAFFSLSESKLMYGTFSANSSFGKKNDRKRRNIFTVLGFNIKITQKIC